MRFHFSAPQDKLNYRNNGWSCSCSRTTSLRLMSSIGVRCANCNQSSLALAHWIGCTEWTRGKKKQTTQNTKQTTQIRDSLIAFSVYRISAIISRNYFHCSKKALAESLSAASHAFPFACVVLSLPPTLENMHVRLSALSKFPSGVSVCVQGCLSFVLLCCSVTVWWKQNE